MSVKALDVARRAGVSISTVYKAFNGAKDISPDTRSHILEIASEMGYSSRRQALPGKCLCVFIAHMEAPHVTYYLYEVMIAFKQIAEQDGFEIVIRDLRDLEQASFNQLMEQNNYRGALILGVNDDNLFFRNIQGIAYPVVLVDNYIEHPFVSCVTSDNLAGMELAVEHLYGLGHRTIGFINGEPHSRTSEERFAGYLNAITIRRLAFDPSLVMNGDYSEYSGGEMAEKLLAGSKDMTAIVCASDLIAIGAIRRLKSMRIRVPEDISVTGFDDIKLSSYITPSLTTVRIKIKDVGYKAFMCLRDLIEYRHAARVIESPALIVRHSAAAPHMN